MLLKKTKNAKTCFTVLADKNWNNATRLGFKVPRTQTAHKHRVILIGQ